MEQQASNNSHKAIIAFIAVVVVAIIVVATVVASPKKNSASAAADTASNSSASASSATSKNGSYTAIGSYESPGGEEKIIINVTLSNGTITATSAKAGAEDSEAQEFQEMFINGYKSKVVGKNITDVHLSSVSGSSLTSQGFNDAISQIENQAKA